MPALNKEAAVNALVQLSRIRDERNSLVGPDVYGFVGGEIIPILQRLTAEEVAAHRVIYEHGFEINYDPTSQGAISYLTYQIPTDTK